LLDFLDHLVVRLKWVLEIQRRVWRDIQKQGDAIEYKARHIAQNAGKTLPGRQGISAIRLNPQDITTGARQFTVRTAVAGTFNKSMFFDFQLSSACLSLHRSTLLQVKCCTWD
jgi:hypothetical protein